MDAQSNFSVMDSDNYTYEYSDGYNYDVDANYENYESMGNMTCMELLNLMFQDDEEFSPNKLFAGEIFTATMFVILAMIGLIGNGLVSDLIFFND